MDALQYNEVLLLWATQDDEPELQESVGLTQQQLIDLGLINEAQSFAEWLDTERMEECY